jgi:hypothetical protein
MMMNGNPMRSWLLPLFIERLSTSRPLLHRERGGEYPKSNERSLRLESRLAPSMIGFFEFRDHVDSPSHWFFCLCQRVRPLHGESGLQGLLRRIFVFSKHFLRQLFNGNDLDANYFVERRLKLIAIIG